MSDTMKAIILELEQLPDEELDRACALEIMPGEELFPDVFNPCSMDAPRWVLHEIIERMLTLGLFQNLYYALRFTDPLRHSISELNIHGCFGINFMTLDSRKLVIAAIAAKRLNEISTEACVGDTSSPQGTRLHPHHSTEQKPFNVNNCLGCGHFKCTEDCPPDSPYPKDGE